MPNVGVHRRRTLCAVRCDALFGLLFWLLGCSISQFWHPFRRWSITKKSPRDHYFHPERQGSADPTPCGGYAGPPCSTLSFLNFSMPEKDVSICFANPDGTIIARTIIPYFIVTNRAGCKPIGRKVAMYLVAKASGVIRWYWLSIPVL